jgi:hypothetical protein
MLEQEINRILNEEGANIIAEIRSLIISTGANASGKTSNSLQANISVTKNKINFGINGGAGFEFIETGRGVTKKGSRKGKLKSIIRQWIDDKGIQPEGKMTKDALAFVITRAIHQRGTLLNLLGETREIQSAVLTQKRIDSVIDKVKIEIQKDFAEQIANTFKL